MFILALTYFSIIKKHCEDKSSNLLEVKQPFRSAT